MPSKGKQHEQKGKRRLQGCEPATGSLGGQTAGSSSHPDLTAGEPPAILIALVTKGNTALPRESWCSEQASWLGNLRNRWADRLVGNRRCRWAGAGRLIGISGVGGQEG